MSSTPTIEELTTSINNLIQSQQSFQTSFTADIYDLRSRLGSTGFTPHHHDLNPFPTTSINTHSLLKPQAYQQPTYINNHISPHLHHQPQIHTPTALNQHQHHYLYHDPCFQPKPFPINAINTFSSFNANLSSFDHFSTIKSTITAPGLTYNNTSTIPSPNWGSQILTHQPQTHTSTALHHHHHQYPYHEPYFQSQSSPIINDFTSLHLDPTLKYESETIKSHEVIAEEQKGFVVETLKDPEPLKLVPDLTIHSDLVSHGVGKQHVFVANDFNFVAPSKRQLDLTTTFTTEADEGLRDAIVTVKGPEDNRHVPPSISQSPCGSDRVESLMIQSIVDVPIGLVPAKHHSIFPTRPLLLPYHFTVVTNNGGNTHSGMTTRQVLNHKLSVSNFESSFDFPVVCTFNFDPGGDKASAAANYGGNRYNFSPLLLPWDRGKIGSYNFLFPVKGAALGATSGRPWVPWSSRVQSLQGVFDADHPLVSPASKLRDNKVLFSLLWLPWDRGRKAWALADEFGLMNVCNGPPHVGLLAFHNGAKMLRRIVVLSKKLGISSLNTI